MPNPMPNATRTDRIRKTLAKLEAAYLRRKKYGRPYGQLLRRVRPLSDAYLAAREEELQA
jgi:hypothetical protein